jgi:hypothetical protein
MEEELIELGMRPFDLTGCYAVVPLPANSSLFALAQREIQVLADAVEAAPDYANLLMHMLNRREAATSPKRAIPTFRHRLPERLERIDVSRHSIVRVVSANNGAEPTALLRNRLMQTAAQFESDSRTFPLSRVRIVRRSRRNFPFREHPQ